MPNQFCRYLSNGYSFNINKNNDVAVKPCCFYGGQGIPLTQDLLENRLQKFSTVTEWTQNCQTCFNLEQAGQSSLRQSGPDWIADHEISSDPVSIDIHLDNECNAACVICSEHASSLWIKEKQKLNSQRVQFYSDKTTINRAIDNIVKTVSLERVKYIKFFGGEPLFTDTHLKFLKHISNPGLVTLHYTTNGSIYPNDETLAVWRNFKTVIFAASLDGIEEQFDYIRWPLTWQKVNENLLRIRNNPDIWNVIFRIEFTVNFLNAYYFDRVETWVAENLYANLAGDKTEINLHPCQGTWNLNKMPLSIKNLILTKYPDTHIIHKMISNLSQSLPLDQWQDFVDIWDVKRKNNWKIVFPDLVNYLNKHENTDVRG
jgi:sulfatase maturation enzyme AslB (radical SAM superfamily)